MPLYEYQCRDCGYRFEKLMSSSTVRNPACPKCGQGTEKQLSTFAAKVEGGAPSGSGGSCCSGGSCGCH